MTDELLLKEYYKLQYDRISQHENRRMQFSNIAIVISSGIITIGIKLNCDQAFAISILIAILLIAINVSAIQFIDKSKEWINFHQERATKIMETYALELYEIIKSIDKPDSIKDNNSLINIQKHLHQSIILLALIYPLIIYLVCIKL